MANFLRQKILIPLGEILAGTTMQKKLGLLKKSQYWTRGQLEELQLDKLKKLAAHCYENVPYYRRYFDKKGIRPQDIKTLADLKKLKVISKADVRQNSEDFRAQNIKNQFPSKTSGSTGHPMTFYCGNEYYSWQWAGHFRAWQWAGFELGDRWAKVGTINPDTLKKKMRYWLMNCRFYSLYKTDAASLKEVTEQLMIQKPKLIYGFWSQLYTLAEYCRKHRVTGIRPAVIITTAEMPTAAYQEALRSQFKGKIFDGYGAGGEGFNIAAQCEHGSYHINEELVIVENIKGELLITALDSDAMPLIRYKIGDKASFGKKCRCGRTLRTLKTIDGRIDDIIRLPNGGMLTVVFFNNIFRKKPEVRQYKIIQERPDKATIKIVRNPSYTRQTERDILTFIKNASGKNFEVEIKYVQSIPLEAHGKIKVVESRLR